jgi:hypothetical protein
MPLPRIRVPKFQFAMSHAAATVNLAFLRQHDFHMNHAIAAQPGSPVSFGSEFSLSVGASFQAPSPVVESQEGCGNLCLFIP